MINIESEYGKLIVDVFNKYEYEVFLKDYFKRPLCVREVQNNDLLFIGLNPSFNNYDIDKCFFSILQNCNHHSYYTQFEKISNSLNTKWDYWDLLFIRETKQERVKQLISTGRDFIWDQLQISKQVISSLRPKVIVVCNTMARRFLGRDKDKTKKTEMWLDFNFEFDNNIGTDRLLELNNVPVFFTSMLTGQRALDRGSQQRLIWHIMTVLKLEKKPSS